MNILRTTLFSILCLSLIQVAAADERSVPSTVSAAKVFLSGAQITRKASARIPSGTSTYVFTGLAQGVDPKSIQVSGKGGFTILSVNHRINYLTESPKKKEIEDLQAKIKKLEKDWAFEKAMQDVWVNEEQVLGKNAAVGGQQNGLTASQLTAVNDYIRQRLITTKTNWLAQQEKLTAIQQEKEKLMQQMQQYQAQAPRPTSEIVVEISSTAEVSASFALSYFVGNAGWTPAYDLRAIGVGKPIELLMKAQVTNNTGEDWDKVELSLSSGNPTLGGVMPTLSPWTLYMPQVLRTESGGGRVMKQKATMDAAPSMNSDASGAYDMEERSASFVPANTIQSHATTFEFVISTPFTVPSDGSPHMIGVQSHEVAATYKHYATPKREKDAFLYARTTGWEDLNLLPGDANVFFEGTFVGQSYLQLDVPKDTLEISLGRDKGIVVERVKRKMTNEKATVGSKRTITTGWDITVRNTKGTAIDLEVRDQYPLSPQSEIEVKLEDKGSASVDERTGMLTWNITLEPKASTKLDFSYTVKHPKEMPVVLE